jgi:hypothetical protein
MTIWFAARRYGSVWMLGLPAISFLMMSLANEASPWHWITIKGMARV